MGVLLAWASNYPAQKDTVATNFPVVTDGVHDVLASHVNALASAVVAVQNVLGGLHTTYISDGITPSGGDTLVYDEINQRFDVDQVGHVSITGSDGTRGYLDTKLVAGTGVTFDIIDPGNDEKLEISAAGASDELVKVSSSDTTPGLLEDKLVAGAGVTLTVLNPTGNESIEITATALADTKLTGATGSVVSTLGTEVMIGGFVFDGSMSYTSIRFLALGGLSSAGADADILLYDMGAPGSPAAPELRATLNLDSLSGPDTDAMALTVDPSPGIDAGEIFDEERMYELRAIINSGSPGDLLIVNWVGLEVS